VYIARWMVFTTTTVAPYIQLLLFIIVIVGRVPNRLFRMSVVG
jgi:hypothetical protein